MGILYTAVVGLIAGWIYSNMKKQKSTMTRNLIVGVAGAIIGGFLFGLLGIGFWFIGDIVGAVIGVFILFWLIDKFF